MIQGDAYIIWYVFLSSVVYTSLLVFVLLFVGFFSTIALPFTIIIQNITSVYNIVKLKV